MNNKKIFYKYLIVPISAFFSFLIGSTASGMEIQPEYGIENIQLAYGVEPAINTPIGFLRVFGAWIAIALLFIIALIVGVLLVIKNNKKKKLLKKHEKQIPKKN